MTRMISLHKKVLFSFLATIGFLGLIEATLRLVGIEDTVPSAPIVARTIDRDIEFPFMTPDPLVFWRPMAGFQGDFLGRPVAINSLGVRGPEIPHPAQPRGRIILCFGDSITFGYGVGDRETYSYFLEQELGPDEVEVVNCGVTGYTSFQVARWLPRLCGKLDCDVAIFCIGWNDATVRPIEDIQYAKQVRLATTGKTMSKYCYVYRLIRNLQVASQFGQRGQISETVRVPFERYQQNLRELVSECRSRGITPIFIDLPGRKGREAPFQHPYSAALRAICTELDVHVTDIRVLSPEFSWESNEEYFIDVCHFSVEGHQYLAKRVAATLIGLGLVETPSRQDSLEMQP